ncbi:hypothetical protein SRABI80_04894 [Peribacillus frigoritolerans]|nr:hypothetical protein SRABI80_04894 [Peribacillus frigoritolerans]
MKAVSTHLTLNFSHNNREILYISLLASASLPPRPISNIAVSECSEVVSNPASSRRSVRIVNTSWWTPIVWPYVNFTSGYLVFPSSISAGICNFECPACNKMIGMTITSVAPRFTQLSIPLDIFGAANSKKHVSTRKRPSIAGIIFSIK